MAKEDIKAKLWEIITTIHIFGGSIMIGAISLMGDNLSKLKSNFLISIIFGAGLLLFFVTLWFIKICYNKRSGTIDVENVDRSFYFSIATMFIFLTVLLTMALI